MRKVEAQKGSILITVCVLLIFTALLVLSFSYWIAVQSKGVVNRRNTLKAEYYGEAGIEYMIQYIQYKYDWEHDNARIARLTDSIPNNALIKIQLCFPSTDTDASGNPIEGVKVDVTCVDIP